MRTGCSYIPVIRTAAVCACAVLMLRGYGTAGDAGSAAAAFLKFSPSPRGTGMGEAYVSVAEDAYSAFWNPAGLAGVTQSQLSATYNASFEDVSHQYVAAAYPLRYGSTLGLSLSRLSVAPFQGYDAQGVKTGGVSSSDMAVGLSYGRVIIKDEIERPVLNLGAGVKAVSERLDDASAATAALDFGAVYFIRPDKYWLKDIQAQEFRLAAAVRNIGPGLKFDRRSSPLPLSATLGGSWHSHPGGSDSLILSLDNTFSNDEAYYAAIGAEYQAFQVISFRAGYRTGQQIGSGLRFGVGFMLSFVDIDYSMSPFGELGAMHKIGMSMRLGAGGARGGAPRAAMGRLMAAKANIDKLDNFANDYLVLARKELEARSYVAAAENIARAFNLEPRLKDGEWGARDARLGAVINSLRLKDSPARAELLLKNGEQSDTAAEAIAAYLESLDLKALLLAHAALGANLRGDALYEALLNLISETVKIHIRRDEILPRTALIKEKFRKAAKNFYTREFAAAVRECEEITMLDAENPLAWTRLGSAYFMMGDKVKARAAYLKALELDPKDSVTRKFLEAQGWAQEQG